MGTVTILQPRGRTFEELHEDFKVITAARTVTEADIVNFAGVSGDYNSIHINAESSARGRFGERIAHGLLGLSIVTGLFMQMNFLHETIEAFASLDWKFRGPIKIGDTIHGEAQVAQRKLMKDGLAGFVILNVAVINQRNETIQKGQWSMVIKTQKAVDQEAAAQVDGMESNPAEPIEAMES